MATRRVDIYARRAPSLAQRFTLSLLLAGCVALAWWMLLFGGAATFAGWFGWSLSPGLLDRRICLAVALSIYYVRVLGTQFLFLKRAISWGETLTIFIWVTFIYALLSLCGGTNAGPLRLAAEAGVALFLIGSWMNSFAELQRHRWKQDAAHRGQLYTGGLFRYSRHPNYLGDLLSFSGLCMIAGSWFTAIIPAIMLCGFTLINIPMLDAHLHAHYGPAFDEYARRTRKLIPFVY